MTASLVLAAGGLAALVGGWLAVRLERERVARGTYNAARAAVPAARTAWLRALWLAVQAVTAVALILGCVYLVITGPQS